LCMPLFYVAPPVPNLLMPSPSSCAGPMERLCLREAHESITIIVPSLERHRGDAEVLLSVSHCASPNPSPFVVAAYFAPTPQRAGTIPNSPRPPCFLLSIEHRRPHPPWSGPGDLTGRSHGTVLNHEVKTSLSLGPSSAATVHVHQPC
jgi:hypothetical protein